MSTNGKLLYGGERVSVFFNLETKMGVGGFCVPEKYFFGVGGFSGQGFDLSSGEETGKSSFF